MPRHTLFISDLHLDPQRPYMLALFRRFLAGIDAEACDGLYILGDLFEAWIGDDEDDPVLLRVLEDLAALSARGVPLSLMHGNRDFLIGERFAERTGARLLADPSVIDLYGRPTLLMHGDTLCTDDVDYQAFRAQVRNPDWQAAFLARPLAERRAIAAGLRETSKTETAGKAAEIMDVNAEAVVRALAEQGVDRLIHGHTHRPALHRLEVAGRAAQRIVLGDWYQTGSALLCTADDCRLLEVGTDGALLG